MKKTCFASFLAVFCTAALTVGAAERTLVSPDGRLAVKVEVGAGLAWSLARDGKTVSSRAPLGLEFGHQKPFGTWAVASEETRTRDTAWTTRLYKKETVRDRANELVLHLREETAPNRLLDLEFRAYDEGVAFRYTVPKQAAFLGFEVTRDLASWRFAPDAAGWFSSHPSFLSSEERTFPRRTLASVKPAEHLVPPAVVETPGGTVAVCEAALVNWAGLFFGTPKAGQPADAAVLEAALAPMKYSNANDPASAVIRTTPASSPWRVTICADSPLGLVKNNDILLNLNPPPEPGQDFSWVEPGASSWDWWVDSNNSLSTELTLKLVDFAAEMGWKYHTIDGGWYGFSRRPNHHGDVHVEIRPGFDLHRIVAHAKAKGIGIWVWLHWEVLQDDGIEETFAKLEGWGVKGVKIDFMDRQDQQMVRWYEKVIRSAARHRLLVNYHGAFHPSGTERTWPNNLTREAVYGNEMSKFVDKIDAVHTATLPFTRFLLGPADYTPGSFGNVHKKDFVPQTKRGHRYGDESDRRPIWGEEIGTRAHALALCVAYESRLMTLCDWPERYRGAPGIEALRALPVAWKETEPLAGEPAAFYAVRRTAFDGRRYVAALTVAARTLRVPLGFLGEGTYVATIYADDPAKSALDAKALAIEKRTVTARDTLKLALADEGGAVVVLERK